MILLLSATNEDLRKRNDRIKRRYEDGLNGVEIAKEFKLSKPSIYQILKGGRPLYCMDCRVPLREENIHNTIRCKKCHAILIENTLRRKLERRERVSKAREKSRLLRQRFLDKITREKLLAIEENNRPITKECNVCSAKYETLKSKTSLFCSKCRANLEMFTGRDRTRELRRMIDKFTCQSCGKIWKQGDRRFDVHHIKGDCGKKSKKYDRKQNINSLTTLCHRCHYSRHDFSEKGKAAISKR